MTDFRRERGTKRWCEIEREGWRNQIGRGQKSNILKERKKIKRKRVRETKEIRENGHSIIEKKRKINLMRNTYMKKVEWNTKERRNKNRKLRTSEGWR